MRSRAKERQFGWLVAGALFVTAAGGSLLAYRWSTPVGNLTVDRIGLICLIALLIVLGRHDRGSTSRFKPLILAIAALLASWLPSLLYGPTPSQGFVQLANAVASLSLFIASIFAGSFLLRRRQGHQLVLIPVWAFIPTALIGLHQAITLLAGQRPTIPFEDHTRLTQASANSARTTFGSGLNDYGIDRVASATGDPSTYGFACAITMVFVLWLYRESNVNSQAVLYVTWILGSIGIVASASATAVAVLCIGTASSFIAIRHRRCGRGRRGKLQALSAVALVLGLMAMHRGLRLFLISAYEHIGMLFFGGGSLGAHLELRAFAWEVFSEQPLWGVGAGSLSTLAHGYEVPFSSVHNVLLLRLAEGGLVGALGLLIFWYVLYRYVPLPLYLAAMSGWFLYIDFARLPFLWVVLGISAAVLSGSRYSGVSKHASLHPKQHARRLIIRA